MDGRRENKKFTHQQDIFKTTKDHKCVGQDDQAHDDDDDEDEDADGDADDDAPGLGAESPRPRLRPRQLIKRRQQICIFH